MNIFVIPSWYPSSTDPLSGVFIKEQVAGLARQLPNVNFGVSLWGSHEKELLLNALEPLANLRKIVQSSSFKAHQVQESENLTTYFDPAYTWTRRFRGGNIQNIIAANERNFDQFLAQYGSIDLIHAQVAHPAGYIARALSEKHNIPFIITENMSPFPLNTFLNGDELSKWISVAYPSSNLNVAPSRLMAEEMSNFDIERVKVIPNFTNGNDFQPLNESHANAVFTFLSVGRLVDYKGFEELLDAFALLKKSGTQVQLRIVGDGSEMGLLRRKCAELALENEVCWLGDLDRKGVRNEMQKCDAFVLTSRVEPFGIVYTEALACGKPIVATKNGGALDIVNERNGLLAEIQNPKSIAAAMNQMIANHDLYQVETIRKDFDSRFGEKVIAAQILACYVDVVTGKDDKW